MRFWLIITVVGAFLFVAGAALAPVVMLGLCGVPLGLLGLGVMAVGLLVEQGRGGVTGAMGVLALLLGLGLVVWATGTGLGPAADWVLAQQRGTGTSWPAEAMFAMAGLSAAASLATAGGVWLRGMKRWAVVLVAIVFFLLPGLSVSAFLLSQMTLKFPLSA